MCLIVVGGIVHLLHPSVSMDLWGVSEGTRQLLPQLKVETLIIVIYCRPDTTYLTIKVIVIYCHCTLDNSNTTAPSNWRNGGQSTSTYMLKVGDHPSPSQPMLSIFSPSLFSGSMQCYRKVAAFSAAGSIHAIAISLDGQLVAAGGMYMLKCSWQSRFDIPHARYGWNQIMEYSD